MPNFMIYKAYEIYFDILIDNSGFLDKIFIQKKITQILSFYIEPPSFSFDF